MPYKKRTYTPATVEVPKQWLQTLHDLATAHRILVQQILQGGEPDGTSDLYVALMEHIESGKRFLE